MALWMVDQGISELILHLFLGLTCYLWAILAKLPKCIFGAHDSGILSLLVAIPQVGLGVTKHVKHFGNLWLLYLIEGCDIFKILIMFLHARPIHHGRCCP